MAHFLTSAHHAPRYSSLRECLQTDTQETLKKSLQVSLTCGKLVSGVCVTDVMTTAATVQSRSPASPLLLFNNHSLSNRNRKELKTGVTPCKQRTAPSSNRSSQREKAKRRKSEIHVGNDAAAMHFLIANLPIRIARNPCALNKNDISNRQKKGVFSVKN